MITEDCDGSVTMLRDSDVVGEGSVLPYRIGETFHGRPLPNGVRRVMLKKPLRNGVGTPFLPLYSADAGSENCPYSLDEFQGTMPILLWSSKDFRKRSK